MLHDILFGTALSPQPAHHHLHIHSRLETVVHEELHKVAFDLRELFSSPHPDQIEKFLTPARQRSLWG